MNNRATAIDCLVPALLVAVLLAGVAGAAEAPTPSEDALRVLGSRHSVQRVTRDRIPASPLRPEVSWNLPWPDVSKPACGYPILENVEHYEVYHGNPTTGAYSHHAHITFQDGTFYAIWSNNRGPDEDAPGQRVLGSISKDGRNWSEFFETFPPIDKVEGEHDRASGGWRALMANGWVVVDGAVYAIAEAFWRGGLHPETAGMSGYGPIAREIRPDGTQGPIFWLVDNPPEQIVDLPEWPDLTDPAFTKLGLKMSRHLADPLQTRSVERVNWTSWTFGLDGQRLCEPSVYRRPDGVLVKLWRDLGRKKTKRLYVSISTHIGHWWPPLQTNIPSQPSKVATGMLPDGRIYLTGNLVTRPDTLRDPLVIALSADGMNFDWAAAIRHGAPRPRHSTRSPSYAYPSAVVANDALWVIYSVGKEDVAVSRVPLSELAVGRATRFLRHFER